MKKYKRVKDYVKKGLRGTAFVCLGAGLIVTPYTSVVGVATMAKGVSDIYKALNLDYTNNSMITVGRNNVINRIRKTPANYIAQGLPSLKQYLEATLTPKKMDFLKLQEVNMFLQLDSRDKSGNEIEYSTYTHAGNYRILKGIEKSGLIQDLSKTKFKNKDLGFERILIGNSKKENKEYRKKRIEQISQNIKEKKGLKNKFNAAKEELSIGLNKKTQLYDIRFKKTDRKLSDKEILKILPFIGNGERINEDKYSITRNEFGNIIGIDYTKEYIFELLKKRSITIANRIKENKVVDKFRESIQTGVKSFEEVFKEQNIDNKSRAYEREKNNYNENQRDDELKI